MKVKIFDKEHEKDLEDEINKFIRQNDVEVVDIKYSVAIMYDYRDQVFCYSALIMYK